MNSGNARSSRLFLTELVFSIFFFIIIVTVCVELFAKAHGMSQEAGVLTDAVERVSNCAEEFVAAGAANGGAAQVFYDQDWNEVKDETEACYVMDIKITDQGKLEQANIQMIQLKEDKIIYELIVDRPKSQD